MPPTRISIKNWKKFQHFKDRNPPWIKLYKDLLDDDEWFDLSPASTKILTGLWLLASEDETKQGILPCDKKIMFRLRLSEKSYKSAISELSHWLIQVDINVISDGYQLGSSETETYSKETEAKEEHPPQLSVEVIQERWNKIAGVKPCKKVDGALREKINRLRKEKSIVWWDEFFSEVSVSPFLTGKAPGKNGSKPFRADLDWVTGPINLGKVLSGKYADSAGGSLSCPHHTALTFENDKALKSHNFIHHPKYEG